MHEHRAITNKQKLFGNLCTHSYSGAPGKDNYILFQREEE